MEKRTLQVSGQQHESEINNARQTLEHRIHRARPKEGRPQSHEDVQDTRLCELALICGGKAMVWAVKPSWELVDSAEEAITDFDGARRDELIAAIKRKREAYQLEAKTWNRQTHTETMRRARLNFACAVLESILVTTSGAA